MELASIPEDESGAFSDVCETVSAPSRPAPSFRSLESGQYTEGHVHHRHGHEAVREFIENNHKEASKIEHEHHEPGCAMIDFYGYEPRVIRRVYRSWIGCFFSHLSIAIFLTVLGFACWQYWVVPFHIVLGETDLDPSMQITQNSEPALPLVGLDFRLANGSSFSDPSYLTYSFASKTIYSQDKLPRKTSSLNYSRCSFTSGEGDAVVATAMCPDTSQVALQGIFSNSVYSYLQLDITPCINRSSSPVVCQPAAAIQSLIAGGTSVIMGDAGTIDLKDITVASKLDPVVSYTSFRYDLTQAFYLKVDVLLTPRDIIKKSSAVDIDMLRERAMDVFFSGVEPTVTTRAAIDPLIRYYVHLDTISQEIELEPYKTLLDLAEMLGAFKALLDLLLGIPLRYLNQWLFLRDVKKEVRSGGLHTDMLLPNSSRPKPHRLQSIMRHIHSVQQQDSIRRKGGTSLLADAKARLKRLFSGGNKAPQSPTRVPLRTRESAPNELPRDHPVWLGHRSARAPDPTSVESVDHVIVELEERVAPFSDVNGSGDKSRFSEVLDRRAPLKESSAMEPNPSDADSSWSQGPAKSSPERHVTNPLFFEDGGNEDHASIAPLEGTGSVSGDDRIRETSRTGQSGDQSVLAHHRSSAPGSMLQGLSEESFASGRGQVGNRRGRTGIGRGSTKAIVQKRSSFSS